jgi:hypothetical protein
LRGGRRHGAGGRQDRPGLESAGGQDIADTPTAWSHDGPPHGKPHSPCRVGRVCAVRLAASRGRPELDARGGCRGGIHGGQGDALGVECRSAGARVERGRMARDRGDDITWRRSEPFRGTGIWGRCMPPRRRPRPLLGGTQPPAVGAPSAARGRCQGQQGLAGREGGRSGAERFRASLISGRRRSARTPKRDAGAFGVATGTIAPPGRLYRHERRGAPFRAW